MTILIVQLKNHYENCDNVLLRDFMSEIADIYMKSLRYNILIILKIKLQTKSCCYYSKSRLYWINTFSWLICFKLFDVRENIYIFSKIKKNLINDIKSWTEEWQKKVRNREMLIFIILKFLISWEEKLESIFWKSQKTCNFFFLSYCTLKWLIKLDNASHRIFSLLCSTDHMRQDECMRQIAHCCLSITTSFLYDTCSLSQFMHC